MRWRRSPRRESRWSRLYRSARLPLLRGIQPIFWALLRVLPPRRHIVVHGWPTLEGNVVELLPVLDRRYPHRVFWLVDDDPRIARRCVRRYSLRRVEVIPKKGLKALWLALTAEGTFFTHGLLTAVRPPANRLVVNLWHGDGPKVTTNLDNVASTVAVSGARLWHAYKAEIFKLGLDDVACTGNPRIAALVRGLSADQWQRLDLDPAKPFAVWLPTFRLGRNARGAVWEDGALLSGRSDMREFHQVSMRHGLSLVVKPHPMDQDDYASLGIRVLTNADLESADVALYELLGSASAMISDTSSAWVDFLAVGRPVGFFLPDAGELAASRGFNVPDLLAILPGPVLRDVRELDEYLELVAGNPRNEELLYEDRRARIGVTPPGDAPGRLLDWLDSYQRDRGRQPLFGPAVKATDG